MHEERWAWLSLKARKTVVSVGRLQNLLQWERKFIIFNVTFSKLSLLPSFGTLFAEKIKKLLEEFFIVAKLLRLPSPRLRVSCSSSVKKKSLGVGRKENEQRTKIDVVRNRKWNSIFLHFFLLKVDSNVWKFIRIKWNRISLKMWMCEMLSLLFF